MSPLLQVAGLLLGGGLLVVVGVLIYRLHWSSKPDARLLFLWGLMKGWPEETNRNVTQQDEDEG